MSLWSALSKPQNIWNTSLSWLHSVRVSSENNTSSENLSLLISILPNRGIKFVCLGCTRTSLLMSFRNESFSNCTAYSRCGWTRELYRVQYSFPILKLYPNILCPMFSTLLHGLASDNYSHFILGICAFERSAFWAMHWLSVSVADMDHFEFIHSKRHKEREIVRVIERESEWESHREYR